MDLQLQGKRALVTGSSAGIGWAIACELAQEGAEVVLHGRDQGRLTAALRRLEKQVQGAKVRALAADLGGAAGCDSLIRGVGEIDILINNLGIFEAKPFEEIDDASWYRFLDTNLMSGVRLSRHYLPQMKARNWGRVVFISSESGVCPPADMVHYGVTKSAQISLSRALAEGCSGTGVTVNAILPGPTRTEGVGQFFQTLADANGKSVNQQEKDFFTEARPTSLLKRLIEPAEVAALVAYVCSPRAAATQGAALRVEGGVVRAML